MPLTQKSSRIVTARNGGKAGHRRQKQQPRGQALTTRGSLREKHIILNQQVNNARRLKLIAESKTKTSNCRVRTFHREDKSSSLRLSLRQAMRSSLHSSLIGRTVITPQPSHHQTHPPAITEGKKNRCFQIKKCFLLPSLFKHSRSSLKAKSAQPQRTYFMEEPSRL